VDPLNTRDVAIGLYLGCLTIISFGLNLVYYKITNGRPYQDIVKFRESAVSADSGNQRVLFFGIFVEMSTIMFWFRVGLGVNPGVFGSQNLPDFWLGVVWSPLLLYPIMYRNIR